MLQSDRCLTSAMIRVFAGLCVVALTSSAALWAADPAQPNGENPRIRSYEFQRDYVQYPTTDRDGRGYVPTVPDERRDTRVSEFGEKYIEPLPVKLEQRQEKQGSMARKLGRGVGNLLLGWMEVFHQTGRSVRDTDPATGILIGFPRGVFFAVDRTCVGLFEVVTFPCPRPGNYDPIIKPEFITSEMWDQPMPVFSDPHNNWSTEPGKDW